MVTKNWFTYGEVDSRGFGIEISGEKTFLAPGRNFETIQVPGRNGDLLMDKKTYKNVQIEIPAFNIQKSAGDFDFVMRDFVSQMAHQEGYQRLETSYRPGSFRFAMFDGVFEPSMRTLNRSGSFVLRFTCKPQIYRTQEYDEWEEIYQEGSGPWMIEGNRMASDPLIRVYGSGSFTIGDSRVEVLEHTSEYMDIDSEIMDAHCEGVNLNSFLRVTGGFPKIKGDDSTLFEVEQPSSITSVLIKTRGWTL